MIHRDKKKKCLTRRGFTCSFWHGMGVWVGAFIAFISPSLFLAQMGSKKRAKSAREDDASQHGSTTEELGAGPSQRGERAKFPPCLAPLGALVALCVCVCVSPDVLTVMVGPRLCSQASTHAAAKGASTNKTTLRLRKWGRPTMGRRQRSNTRVSTRSLPSTHLPLQPCCGQRAHRRGFPLLAHLHRTREEARERFVHRRRRCLI